MRITKSEYLNFFTFAALIWATLAGSLVFFYPLNEFGEFAIPKGILLTGDIALATLSIPALWFIIRTKSYTFISKTILFFIAICSVVSLKLLILLDLYNYAHFFIRNYFLYFIFGFIVYTTTTINDHKKNEKLIFFLYYLVISPALIVCILYYMGYSYLFWETTRLTGALINHNSFSFVCLFLLFWTFNNKKYIHSSLIIFLIILSGSLTGIAGISLLFFFGAFKGIIALLILVLIFISYYSFFMDLHFIYKFQQLFIYDAAHMTSKSAREAQLNWFLSDFITIPSNWLVGSLDSTQFERFDSQYYNFFVNFGFFGLFTFLLLIYLIILKNKSKEVFIFILWAILALAMTAFLSRWNLIIIFFLIIGYGTSFQNNTKLISK